MVRKLSQPKQHRRGRPPTGDPGTPVQVRLRRNLLAAIDKFIADDGWTLSRPEAIRRLVEVGLKQPKE
jgi:hypothetical protein